MSELEIERGVPIPTGKRNRGSGRPRKYPFPDLNVGDSFVVPADMYVRQYASVAGRSLGRRFTVRRVADGLRVWRVE